ncbi:unnamed protein product [Camellia sinensis]
MMEAISIPTYRCLTCGCTGNGCRDNPYLQGLKLEWPELVGVSESKATAVIKRENPKVIVVSVYDGSSPVGDVCCNRVYLYVTKPGGVVDEVPRVG